MPVFRTISFEGFPQRTERLQAIERYAAYPIMYYRTNLVLHSQRVCWIVEEIASFAVDTLPGFDPELARSIALVHDDPEMVTGDINLVHKVRMSPTQLQEIEKREEEACDILARNAPELVNGFSYKELMLRAVYKDCVEAQVASLADKLDAYGESSHELVAGNQNFTLPLDINPIDNYNRILGGFGDKYPLLKNLLTQDHPLLRKPEPYDVLETVRAGRPHTPESLQKDTGIPYYEFWKKLTLRRMGEEGIKVITTQKEFPKNEPLIVREYTT